LDRDSPRLHRMFELAMAAALTRQIPSVLVEVPEEIANLHLRG